MLHSYTILSEGVVDLGEFAGANACHEVPKFTLDSPLYHDLAFPNVFPNEEHEHVEKDAAYTTNILLGLKKPN